ncbi:MAG: ornithine--oxo-acid transaminase [Myxococcota bacterium]|nr:ornithine--oxo-acid transaminase [Myxococcota bacterium]
MSATREIIETTERYGAHNYKPLPVVIAKAEGAWVEDPEGNRYLDFLSSYSAVNHGHRHPRIIEALRRQADRCTLTSRAFYNDQLGAFCKELAVFCGMEMVLPMNTGAEGVETALKMARKWGYRVKGVPRESAEVIVCDGNFHGRTIAIVGFSTESLYREDFGPYPPGFKAIPYGDAAALERAVTPNTVAFLVEPIQGEAGVVMPPAGYLSEARRICSRNRVLLLMDEIQTGFGRTGKRFCWEHEPDAGPDALILGKALGGGVLPISAVVASADVLGLFRPGEHGSTFGGNPLACAVAREAIRVLVEEGLVERSARLGEKLLGELRRIRNPLIREVRGRGLFVGVHLAKEAGGARSYCERLKREGLLCKETHDDVIRLAPPLVIEEADLDAAIGKVRKVLEA